MPSSHIVTEFIYLSLKPDVKPEDPDNDGGRLFINSLNAVKQRCGYLSSSWGRTIENENNVVWIIGRISEMLEWKDNTGCVPLSMFAPVLDPETQPIAFHTTLTPPLNDILTTAPVIELAVLAFPKDINPPERTALNNDLINFRSTCLQLTDSKPPSAFSMGWVERPGSVPHQDSKSGRAQLIVLVVGWESREQHEEVRKTTGFGNSIAPIRERMLPAIKALQMRHVKFKAAN
ncbi:predicted protein [Uncinocarpus reesii 1704]|uniref:Uncharacterized protein n=1 Tax=Uncinocarpus reesii (strain UAMH 1704) TaxID=336963 RepID=C4JFJ9_UNCRE|nr:uncharacterized protein UREG_01013 [Uncinocarpus reesii 1704]EEP76164.1 predicted protein [Uncinocarpus reesii 1704]